MRILLLGALEKLFPVQRHEWPKVLMLLSVATLLGVGASVSRAASEAMFLIHFGVDYLPYALLAYPILALVTSTIYSAYADRIPDDRLMIYTSLLPVPLIVPPGCRFRVGGETRTWQEGVALAFDDTIDHEAWNDSDQLRVVLIFDVWNPHLSLAEQMMIKQFYATADARKTRDNGPRI